MTVYSQPQLEEIQRIRARPARNQIGRFAPNAHLLAQERDNWTFERFRAAAVAHMDYAGCDPVGRGLAAVFPGVRFEVRGDIVAGKAIYLPLPIRFDGALALINERFSYIFQTNCCDIEMFDAAPRALADAGFKMESHAPGFRNTGFIVGRPPQLSLAPYPFGVSVGTFNIPDTMGFVLNDVCRAEFEESRRNPLPAADGFSAADTFGPIVSTVATAILTAVGAGSLVQIGGAVRGSLDAAQAQRDAEAADAAARAAQGGGVPQVAILAGAAALALLLLIGV